MTLKKILKDKKSGRNGHSKLICVTRPPVSALTSTPCTKVMAPTSRDAAIAAKVFLTYGGLIC